MHLAATGLAALSSPFVVVVAAWGLLAGTVATWIGHRYECVTDEGGMESASLGDATCPSCSHLIVWTEALPGRAGSCAGCGHALGRTWLGGVLAVTAGSLAMLATWGPTVNVIPFLWLVPVLVTAAIVDLRTMLIPRHVVWVGFGVGLASIAAVALSRGNPGELVSALIGAAGYFAFLFVMHVVHPGGMGFGDVRLALVLGLYLGWIDLRLPLFGLLLANLVYLAYALPRRLSRAGDDGKFSPFGPGLAMGTVLAVCFWSTLVG